MKEIGNTQDVMKVNTDSNGRKLPFESGNIGTPKYMTAIVTNGAKAYNIRNLRILILTIAPAAPPKDMPKSQILKNKPR